MEEECSHGQVIFMKGDIIATIRKAGDFLDGALTDSLFNLNKMAQMQMDVLEHQKVTFTRVNRGQVPPEFAVEGGPSSPGLPAKLYVPVPIHPTVGNLDNDELDTLIEYHLKMGMPRYEMGQFLIRCGCPVDLTMFGKWLQQQSGPLGELFKLSHLCFIIMGPRQCVFVGMMHFCQKCLLLLPYVLRCDAKHRMQKMRAPLRLSGATRS